MTVSKERYGAQRRGDRGAYERYLSGMDASMRQKVALTAAHLMSEGQVADMGMGSGAGSDALAALYPALEVVGVDVEPTMVELAKERFGRENLRFEVGDIAKPVFAPQSLDGILNSSVLHHVTSFNGYGAERATAALRAQVAQLAEQGILIVRDFVAPDPSMVELDLPADDGDDSSEPTSCSTAALFELFAGSFRSLAEAPGFPYQPVVDAELPPGWRRYLVAAEHAVEFVLRKDYRSDWHSEAKEAYTYYTQEEFEQVYAELGLRVLASAPIWNPWIVRNRFRGKFYWREQDGTAREYPPTNYVIVGEKVAPDQGVRFRPAAPRAPLGYLELSHYRHRGTGQVMDLVRRPHRTLDVMPWFAVDGDQFLLVRASYPRPILTAADATALDGRRSAGYVVEPLAVIQTDKPLGLTVEQLLAESAGISGVAIRNFRSGSRYYPSPGGIQEEVRSVFVEVDSVFTHQPLRNSTGWTTAGRVLAIEARQLLRAAQVGGLPDARLELNAYDLLHAKGSSVGPWIGEQLTRPEVVDGLTVSRMDQLADRPARRVFERATETESTGFLRLQAVEFEELDHAGQVRKCNPLEFVIPGPLSINTVSAGLIARSGDELLVGVDDDDLPAAQGFVGNSELLVAPAWRLPAELARFDEALSWVRSRLAQQYGVQCAESWRLGGAYYPSLGVTPEVVHPVALEVVAVAAAPRTLRWIPLSDAVAHASALQDGHLRILLWRAAHALGLLTAD